MLANFDLFLTVIDYFGKSVIRIIPVVVIITATTVTAITSVIITPVITSVPIIQVIITVTATAPCPFIGDSNSTRYSTGVYRIIPHVNILL